MKQIIKKILQKIKRLLKAFATPKIRIKPYAIQQPTVLRRPLTWSSTPVKVCVIGSGKQGRAIAKAASNIEGCILSGLCDRDQERLDAAAKQDGVPKNVLYTDIQSALDSQETDAVFIATNAASHCDVALEVLKYNVKRVCIEKPIATSLEQAWKIKDAAKDCFVAINHSRRWNLDYKHMLSVIKRNALGRPTAAHICWGPAGMGNMGVHLIDAVRMLCDSPLPIQVHGNLDKTDTPDPGGCATIKFDNGLNLFLNTSIDLKSFHKHIDIYFEHGSIRINENLNEWHINIMGSPTVTYPLQDIGRNTARAQRVVYGLIHDSQPSSSISDGIIALECVLAIQASSLSNETIKAPFNKLRDLTVHAR